MPRLKGSDSAIYTGALQVRTKGFCDILDITSSAVDLIEKSGIRNGILALFVPGSTASLTTNMKKGQFRIFNMRLKELLPTP